MEYKDKLNAFKSSARVYRQEKNRLAEIEGQENDAALNQYVKYVQQDVAFVEEVLDRVNQLCGPGARLIIWEIYVENDTQVKVAQEHGMTRRQLQYSLEKWMRKVFDDADA